jgi:hypothetical protein
MKMFELKEGCEAVSVRKVAAGSWVNLAPAVYVAHYGAHGVLRWKVKEARPCGVFGGITRANDAGQKYAAEKGILFIPGLRQGMRASG